MDDCCCHTLFVWFIAGVVHNKRGSKCFYSTCLVRRGHAVFWASLHQAGYAHTVQEVFTICVSKKRLIHVAWGDCLKMAWAIQGSHPEAQAVSFHFSIYLVASIKVTFFTACMPSNILTQSAHCCYHCYCHYLYWMLNYELRTYSVLQGEITLVYLFYWNEMRTGVDVDRKFLLRSFEHLNFGYYLITIASAL